MNFGAPPPQRTAAHHPLGLLPADLFNRSSRAKMLQLVFNTAALRPIEALPKNFPIGVHEFTANLMIGIRRSIRIVGGQIF